jgi:hypothetical protein
MALCGNSYALFIDFAVLALGPKVSGWCFD